MTAGDHREVYARGRGAARLAAVQALYQMEMTGQGVEAAVDEFIRHRLGTRIDDALLAPADEVLFAAILRGVVGDQAGIDRLVAARLAQGWSLDRIDPILRAVLRAGTWELAHRPDMPALAAISEYVGLTDAFFDGEEPRFVNGIMDRLARALRPAEFEGAGDAPA